VIVYQHNHIFDKPFELIMREELPERLGPPAWMKQWTHAEIEAGADIVVMHGAPLLHGIEIYKSHVIFYDLGNFIFQVPPPDTLLDEPILWESVVATVEMQNRELKSIKLRPIAQNKLGDGTPDTHDEHTDNAFLRTRGIPKPATGEQAHYILQRLTDLSRPFGTTIVTNGVVAEIKLK
jgi:poly-gamma-glutamate synthesis protein (capsule biosynthesis protein)